MSQSPSKPRRKKRMSPSPKRPHFLSTPRKETAQLVTAATAVTTEQCRTSSVSPKKPKPRILHTPKNKMAQAATVPTTSTTKSRRNSSISLPNPKLKFAVPFSKPKHWEGLPMGDPGPDYDTHEDRVLRVDAFYADAVIKCYHRQLVILRKQPVIIDDEEAKTPKKRTDSGIGMSEDESGRDGEKTETKNEKKRKGIWGCDAELSPWEGSEVDETKKRDDPFGGLGRMADRRGKPRSKFPRSG